MMRHAIAAARVAARLWPLLLLPATGCGRKPAPMANQVAAATLAPLPADPADPRWEKVPVSTVTLVPQDMVEPRLLVPTTPSVTVQAATDGERITFRIGWVDSTRNDRPGAARFNDGCAVQLPADGAANLPAPQMGEAGRPVEISFWSASWQARVDGRPDEITALYPNAPVPHYPFEAASLKPGSPEQEAMAKRYAPARASDNWMAGDGTHAVQDLLAEGPGTLAMNPAGRSDGRGVRVDGGWQVVISRSIPAGLRPPAHAQVAFAVWDGGRQEVGARKMRSVWVPLTIGGAP